MSWVTSTTVTLYSTAHAQDQVLQVEARLRVDGRERLVHQQQLGLVGQRAGDGDPLLHPAGQLPRVLLADVTEADRVQHLVDSRLALRRSDPAHLERYGDVAGDGQPREQRAAVVLEDDAEPARAPRRMAAPSNSDRRRRSAAAARSGSAAAWSCRRRSARRCRRTRPAAPRTRRWRSPRVPPRCPGCRPLQMRLDRTRAGPRSAGRRHPLAVDLVSYTLWLHHELS